MTTIQFKVAKTTTEHHTRIHNLLLLQSVIQIGKFISFVIVGYAIEFAVLSRLDYKYFLLNYECNTILSVETTNEPHTKFHFT